MLFSFYLQEHSVFPQDLQQVQSSQQAPFAEQHPSRAQHGQPHWQKHFSQRHFSFDFMNPANIKLEIISTAIVPNKESIQLYMMPPHIIYLDIYA
jgi:hypothetical protein